MRKNRKIQKRLAARVKDYATVKEKHPGSYHKPGSLKK